MLKKHGNIVSIMASESKNFGGLDPNSWQALPIHQLWSRVDHSKIKICPTNTKDIQKLLLSDNNKLLPSK